LSGSLRTPPHGFKLGLKVEKNGVAVFDRVILETKLDPQKFAKLHPEAARFFSSESYLTP
jgi:hypothetical protein